MKHLIYPDKIYSSTESTENSKFKKTEYSGRINYYYAYIKKTLTKNCENNLCGVCLSENNETCITCKTKEFTMDSTNTSKICLNKEGNISCTNIEILNNQCKNKSITIEQLSQIYYEIKEKYLTKETKNTIIQTENVIFQLSTISEQKSDKNSITSNIDFGECETLLKKNNNIPLNEELLIYKVDAKYDNLTKTFVQYEIYNPLTLKKLDLSVCSDIKIIISSPVNLNNKTILLADSLNKLGYNLFDPKDKFYNDICSLYTTEEK